MTVSYGFFTVSYAIITLFYKNVEGCRRKSAYGGKL